MRLPAPLQATIQKEAPSSILVVTSNDMVNATTYQDAALQTLTFDQLLNNAQFERKDLVFIARQQQDVEPEKLMCLIAKCRDLIASKVLVENPNTLNPGLAEKEFLALGFQRCAITQDEQKSETTYYYYDLKTYKPTPDWLNPKYWANPENWDKFRW